MRAQGDTPGPSRNRGRERTCPLRASGNHRFVTAFSGLGPIRPILVGGDGIALERFLLDPAGRWVEPLRPSVTADRISTVA
jgi:hypothetical protein